MNPNQKKTMASSQHDSTATDRAQSVIKKRGHGNRRRQRFRTKWRSTGMNNHDIGMLMKTQIHPANQEIHEDEEEEEIIDGSTMQTQSNMINESMFYENQDHSMGTGEGSSSSVPTTTTHQQRFKRSNLSTDHWKQTSKLIPKYHQLSPYQFKDMLVKVIPPSDHRKIQRWLTNMTILEFIQQRAEFMSTVSQLKIEQNYWNYIADLMTTPVGIWLSGISKDITNKNTINWDHKKTKRNIQHRQQIIKNHLKRAENKLNFHLQQSYPFDWTMENPTSTNNDQLINIIADGLAVLVENSLYYFRTNFEQKKILLKFDIQDAELVESFYDFNPTNEEILTVQKIWRTKVKSCKRTLREKKKKKNHSSMIMNRMTMENIHQAEQNELFSFESFSPSMRGIIAARLANIEQRTQQMMQFNNTIPDNNFY